MTNSRIPSLSQLNGVDLFKYIMAFAVIAIHIQTPCGEHFPGTVEWFIRLAVPFYFTTSGFLMARKLATIEDVNEKKRMLRIRAFQVFRLFALWLAIYFPISVVYSINEGHSIVSIMINMVIDVLIRGEINMAWPLWFLYSLGLYTLALSWLIESRKKMILISIISLILIYMEYLIQTVDRSGLTHIETIIINILPLRVLSGGGYIITGYLLFNIIERHYIPILTIVTCLLSMVLFYFGFPFSALSGGLSLFLIAYKLPIISHASLFRRLRVQSMWIYYTHMCFIIITIEIAKAYGISLELWRMFICTSLLTLCSSVALSYLQNIPSFQFLKGLVK